jgi:peptide chain release factor 1
MKPFIKETLDRQQWRLEELDALLSAPDLVNDMARFRQLSREHAELSELGALYQQYQQRSLDLAEAQSLLRDPEMADMAAEEITACETDLLRLDEALQALLLPKDPDDERNAYLEIRAGTGGDESALFAADLLRMYTR